jgi:pimeloyl-ACP methyl ester carboxylesterase
VLALAGEKDQIIPPTKSKALAAMVPRATLTILEKAGHMPMLEDPHGTTATIAGFMQSLQVSGPANP